MMEDITAQMINCTFIPDSPIDEIKKYAYSKVYRLVDDKLWFHAFLKSEALSNRIEVQTYDDLFFKRKNKIMGHE